MAKKKTLGKTKYLKTAGDPGNYKWAVTLDYNEDGYLGITQEQLDTGLARVLLSPAQLTALRAFTRRRPR
jgi:hypothetical protein